jgi:hypothetical protein
MASLGERIKKAQFQTLPSTKLREVAAKFGLQPPISVLHMAKLLEPETVDWHGSDDGQDQSLVSAGFNLHLTSTGFWTFTGDVVDSGHGAKFALVMVLRFVDSSGNTKLFGESAQLSGSESYPFSKQGRDLWIARNWDAIRRNGFSWKLHADNSMTVWQVIGIVVTAGLVASGGAVAAHCNDNNSWEVQNNPDGSSTATCHLN